MAFEYQGYATLGVNLNRQKYGPLDVSTVFTSTPDLMYYITKGQTQLEGLSDYWKNLVPYPYETQIISLIENGQTSVFMLVANGDVFDTIPFATQDYVQSEIDKLSGTGTSIESMTEEDIDEAIQNANS